MVYLSQACVVVPVYQDDTALSKLLSQVAHRISCVVVDGGCSNRTREIVQGAGAQYLHCTSSRGEQIALGVSNTDAPWIWILHVDTVLCSEVIASIEKVVTENVPCWGRFDVDIPGVAVVARLMNWRSRLTKICTGDQGMFVHRSLIDSVGGIPAQPLMEDIELSSRLRAKHSNQFVTLPGIIVSSPRRWQTNGVIRTIISMWWYRLRYYFGASAAALYRDYYGG